MSFSSIRMGFCARRRLRRGPASRFFAIGALAFLGLPLLTLAQSQSSTTDEQNAILTHLNAVIDWYRQLSSQSSTAQEPSDTVYSSNAENLSEQVVRLAFQSARAESALLSKPQANQKNTGAQNAQQQAQDESPSGSSQHYTQIETDAQGRVADDQEKIKELKAKPPKPAKGKPSAEEQIQFLEGKLALEQAALEAIQQLKKFVDESSAGGSGLERSINELERSVPEIFHSLKSPPPPAQATASTSPPSGLFGQLMLLYKEMLSIRSIEQYLSQNDQIEKFANNLRAPLRDKLRDTFQEGQTLGNQNDVSKQQYEALAQRFKQLSAALVPLSEEIVLLEQSRANLVNWRRAHTTESQSLLLSILLRVAVILGALGIIFAIAEAWRRLTFRYIHDPRRRRQFLIMRRFVVGFFMVSVVVLGFVSEFSSLATFAGFVTAGIAVGLQTVLLSVAAYFFVIGRYGIRVGDRISIAGVTGDVVDLGLVRFYVMEFASSGAELFPTGRIVVFSNSVLFQPTTPLYKQLPGTHYTWHEAVLPLASGADRELLQKSLHEAAQAVYQEFSRQAEWQRAFDYNMEEITMKPPQPEQHLQFGDTGAELVIRYPVDLHRGPEIDEKMIQALMDTIAKNPKIASSLAATPKVRAAVKL